MKKTRLAEQLLRSTILTGVAASAVMPAFAQDDEGDTIVVTGSRIVRDDLEAPSPVTTVDSEALVLTNTVNSEQFLNQLPQVIPALDSSSNNPGNGTATVDLRGLGAKRSLVLVDGLRFPASGVGGVVDLNNIPSALVDRIDVVTGGASAVYGSEAMAGVVNFRLKNDFEGIQFDVSDEFTGKGDANTFNGTVTVGGNFGDGRGNAVVSASYTNRQALFQGERDFSKFTFFDPGTGGTAFIAGGSASVPGTRIRGRTTDHFGINPVGNPAYPECTGAPAGQACTGFFFPVAGDLQGFNGAASSDGYNYAPSNYLQVPQERYSIFARATYEITDAIDVYVRGMYANNTVDGQLAPTPYGFTVAINENNPLIPAELFNLMFNDPNTNVVAPVASVPNCGPGFFCFRFARRGVELGPRNSLRDTSTFQIAGGINYDLGNGWKWTTDLSFGRSTVVQLQTGNVSIAAVRQALLSTDGVNCTVSTGGCAALNLFGGPDGVSPAAAAFISRTGTQFDRIEQTQIVSAVSGVIDSFKTPWADSGLGLAVGLEYREEFANSLPDSVLGPDVLGFNQALPVAGRYDSYEAFAEVNWNLIEDKPFFHKVGINGAYRYANYSTTNVGSIHSFSAGLDWEPVDGVRFRGQFQRAVRAPNIGELFAASTNGFPGAQDPCSTGLGKFGAGTIAATCVATGVPAVAVGTSFQSNGQIEVLAGGNPNLSEESADTYTGGIQWEPSFAPGLIIQADYYNIFIHDAVFTPSLQTVLDSCHLQNVTAACNLIVRDPATGAIESPFLPILGPSNLGNIETRGIDFQLDYARDFGSIGSVSVRYNGNYTLANGYQTDPISAPIECKGLFGSGNCGEPTPVYKHATQVSWMYDAFTTSLRWRFIAGVDADATGLSDLSDDIGAFNYLDATVQWELSDSVKLTAGVQNLTGKNPPILGSTVAEQANTWPATYETLGRQIFIGASVKF